MSDPERTAQVSLRASDMDSKTQHSEPGGSSQVPLASDERATEETPSETSEKRVAIDRLAGRRLNRQMRLARLRALQNSGPAGDGASVGRFTGDESAQTTDEVPTTPDVPPKTGRPSRLVGPPREEGVTIPFVPQRGRARSMGTIASFVLCVLLPVALIGIYFLFYASNQYVSSFKFVVRDARTAATGVSQGVGGLSLFGAGAAPNPVENYMVADYLVSRQAVDTLHPKLDVMGLYSDASIDWIARFHKGGSIEAFMKYWERMVSASYDQVTGIGTAHVRAFRPKDAYEIATLLVAQSEDLVNGIANKPQQDAIRFAEADLKRAEERLKEIRRELNTLRNTEQVIDPQTNVVASNILLAQTLRANLSQMQTELSALSKQRLSADAPASQTLQSRIKATREQLALVEGQVANERDGANSISRVVGKFEQLDLERQFAQNMVQSLMQNLEQARAAALAKHVYVTAFISPALPESSTYPRRYLSIFIAAFVCFLFWILGLLIVRSIREHFT